MLLHNYFSYHLFCSASNLDGFELASVPHKRGIVVPEENIINLDAIQSFSCSSALFGAD